VDETQHTLTLEKAGGREVRLPKAGTRASLVLDGGQVVALDFTQLAFRPQDRIKRVRLRRSRAGA
jgi:RNase P/RNase MRP subunit p29